MREYLRLPEFRCLGRGQAGVRRPRATPFTGARNLLRSEYRSMFKLSEIKDLVKLVDQSSLQELEIQNEGYRLSIRKPSKTESVIVSSVPNIQQSYVPAVAQPAAPAFADAAPAAPAVKPVDDAKLHKIVSPMVGTFYQAPSPDAPPFVSVGDKIHEKSIVCIIEAMKLMNDIPAEVKGEVVDILVENGQLVDYGQTLFLVKAD